MPDASAIGLPVAFLAGVVSFLSPCVLPLVPGYVSYVAGVNGINSGELDSGRKLRMLALSLCFILGFSTVFIALGASASAIGQLLQGYRYEMNIVGGIIIIGFGLFMIGMVSIPQMQSDFRFRLSVPGGRVISAYVLGLAFGFGWTPCIGPILGAILTTTAASAEIGEGIGLLAVYSAGLGVPFILAALFTDRLMLAIKWSRRLGRWLYQVAGVVMIVMGIAMVTDMLSAFSYWLLGTFPILGRIG